MSGVNGTGTDSTSGDGAVRTVEQSAEREDRTADREDRSPRPGPTVAKFGGSSLADPEFFANVLDVVEDRSSAGSLVAVVSALGSVTDELEALAEGRGDGERLTRIRRCHFDLAREVLCEEEFGRFERLLGEQLDRLETWEAELDDRPGLRHEILAVGERLSAPLVAAALRCRGTPARAIDAARLVRTRWEGGEVVVNLDATRAAVTDWWDQWDSEVVPIVTGFIGGTGEETTTLSRGGSDYSAAIFARVLEAGVLERWTDVAGLYRRDPDSDPRAERYGFLSFEEAHRRTREGTLGMHPRTLDPLLGTGTRVLVRGTPDPDAPGTWIGASRRENGTREKEHLCASAAPS